jgi:hypothetical protein
MPRYQSGRQTVQLIAWSIVFCLLILGPGCTKVKREAVHVEVSGIVLHNDKPLPGGEVTFVTVEGAFTAVGRIDEKGHYTISAPVGDVRIAVNNNMLIRAPGAGQAAKMKGAGRPEQGAPDPIKGTYKPIDKKYNDPQTSGLTYTVTNGPQTHDIVMKD